MVISQWKMFGLSPYQIVAVNLEIYNNHDLMSPMEAPKAHGMILSVRSRSN